MSKEVEAFKRMMKVYGDTNSLEGTYDDLLIIKKALQRLESIDNAKPSEALNSLERIGKEYLTIESKDFDECFNTIKQALINFDLIRDFLKDLSKLTNETNLNKIMKKLQEQEKVLKIIKEYQVDIWI